MFKQVKDIHKYYKLCVPDMVCIYYVNCVQYPAVLCHVGRYVLLCVCLYESITVDLNHCLAVLHHRTVW